MPDTILEEDHPRIISILGWSLFKVVSVSAVLYPRWPPLLKIEISSNGQNCSILNQKVPKLELYKHNDELFNIYYGIFYELWTFSNGGHLGYKTVLTDTILKGDHPRIISAKFGWDWLSSFRGEEFFLISSPLFSNLNPLLWNYWANLNQTLLKWSLGDPLSKLCPSVPSCIQDGRHY
jgi:hypothetical protein